MQHFVTKNGRFAVKLYRVKERVEILQKAFMDTMTDPEFVADTNRSNLEIDPTSGPELKKLVDGQFDMPPDLVKKLKKILVPN